MSEKWVRDTGLVFALLFLVLGFRGNRYFLVLCALFLVCVLFAPGLIRPLAKLWMLVAEVLGKVMNPVFFGLVFFVIVTPVGLLKRLFTGDARDLHKHTGCESAFVPAGGLLDKEAFEKPY